MKLIQKLCFFRTEAFKFTVVITGISQNIRYAHRKLSWANRIDTEGQTVMVQTKIYLGYARRGKKYHSFNMFFC